MGFSILSARNEYAIRYELFHDLGVIGDGEGVRHVLGARFGIEIFDLFGRLRQR